MSKDAAVSQITRRPISSIEYARFLDGYNRAVAPLLDMKLKLYRITIPKILIHTDGTIEQVFNFTADQKELLRLIDESIAQIAECFGAAKP